MSDGSIRNEAYLRKARIYAMTQKAKHCRGGISPSDMDGRYFAHCRYRGGRALMFEYKTAGAAMLDAQLEALEFFVGVANGRIACVVAEHPDLDTVEPIADVLRWRIGGFVAGQVQWGPWVGGPNAGRRMGLFIEKFYSDASFLETKITAYLAKSGSESFK